VEVGTLVMGGCKSVQTLEGPVTSNISGMDAIGRKPREVVPTFVEKVGADSRA